MADSNVFEGLTAWLAAVALVAGSLLGVVTFGPLDVGETPPKLDDLGVSNEGDVGHTVRVEVIPANGSGETTVFETTVRLEPDERRRFDAATDPDEEYLLVVAVDDRESESFEIAGADDRCTTTVQVESDATVEVWKGCA